MAEKETENFESFNVVSDFYLPLMETEQKYSSPILKRFRENEIDPYEFLNEPKVEGVGKVIKVEDQEEKNKYSAAFLDFFKDLPEAAVAATAESFANIGNNAVQLAGAGSNLLFRGTENDDIAKATTTFAQLINKKTENFVGNIDKYRKENDVNGVSDLLTDIGIDIGAAVPINKMLKKTGLPSFIATPLSFGLAYGITGGDTEAEQNIIIDSQVINRTNELLNVLEDTPESEVAELVATTFEGTAWGAAGDRLVKVFKLIKNNIPAFMNQQTATTIAGSAASGEAAMQIQQNQDLNAEKKNLNFDDQSQISSPMPDDNQFASGGFGPIFFSMIKEAAKKIPNKASGQQMFNTIKNTQGVKQSELKWTGLDDFLKDKKSVTKEEVKEFLQNNSLDVTEVKFSKNLKPNKELQKLIDDFEPKYIDERTNAPNYDVYETFIGKSADNRARGTMDFQTLKSVIGDDVVPESFEVVAEKFNAPKVLRYKNLNYDDPNILLRPSNDDFFITPIELEKYKIERIRRMKNMNTGGVKFEAQTEAGGKDYTELVFRLKVGGQDIGIPVEVSGQKAGDMITRKSLVPYKNPAHFNVKNEIAHVRFKTRYLEDVKPLKTILEASRKNLPLEPNKNLKVLSVEEMQSDFAIAARKGFQNNPDAKLMDFPYKNNWYELTIKRLLRYAADNNFDAVAIPKGSVAAKRYGETIGKAQEVNVTPFLDSVTNEPVFQVRYFGAGNREIKRKEFVEKEIFELEKEIGSKNFAQLKNNIDDFLTNKPDSDLKNTYYFSKFDKPIIIGSGKGKYELYDKAIPSFIKKYTKKWNAQVYDTEINTREIFVSNKTDQFETIPVTIIKLTDDMKQSVQQDGQALFSIFGIGAGAKIASDSMQNNSISKQTNN